MFVLLLHKSNVGFFFKEELFFTTTAHICHFEEGFQTKGYHKVRDYWDRAYCRSDGVHMKSFIACSNSLDIASGGGNGDAAAEQQGSTLEKTR